MAEEKRRRRRRRRGGGRGRGGGAPSGEAGTADAGAPSEGADSPKQSTRRDKRGEPVSQGKGGKKPPPTTVFGLPRFLFVLSVSVFVALLIVTVINIVTGDDEDSTLDLGAVQTFPDQGRRHLTPGETFTEYNSNPPTSGPQDPVGVEPGIYDQPQRFEELLPLLERGGVAVYYHPDRLDPLDLAALEGFAADAIAIGCRLAVSPRSDIGAGAVVATAWRHTLRVEGLTPESQAQIGDFIRGFNGLYDLADDGEIDPACDFRTLVGENEDGDVAATP